MVMVTPWLETRGVMVVSEHSEFYCRDSELEQKLGRGRLSNQAPSVKSRPDVSADV